MLGLRLRAGSTSPAEAKRLAVIMDGAVCPLARRLPAHRAAGVWPGPWAVVRNAAERQPGLHSTAALCRDEPVFDLDPQQLEQRYKGLQRQLHPDKYSTGGWMECTYCTCYEAGWFLYGDGVGTAANPILRPLPPAAASPLEKEYAHQQAAVVNAAYDVLKKPLRRAHYIVSRAFL